MNDGGSGSALYAPFLEQLPVSGASITVVSGTGVQSTICSSDAIATRLEELQFEMGEGPTPAVFAGIAPFSAPRAHARQRTGVDPRRTFDLGLSAHLGELAAYLDLVAVSQLSASPAFDFSVHAHLAVGDRLPGVRTLVDQVGEFQELTQPDGVVSDRNCSRTHDFSRTLRILQHP